MSWSNFKLLAVIAWETFINWTVVGPLVSGVVFGSWAQWISDQPSVWVALAAFSGAVLALAVIVLIRHNGRGATVPERSAPSESAPAQRVPAIIWGPAVQRNNNVKNGVSRWCIAVALKEEDGGTTELRNCWIEIRFRRNGEQRRLVWLVTDNSPETMAEKTIAVGKEAHCVLFERDENDGTGVVHLIDDRNAKDRSAPHTTFTNEPEKVEFRMTLLADGVKETSPPFYLFVPAGETNGEFRVEQRYRGLGSKEYAEL